MPQAGKQLLLHKVLLQGQRQGSILLLKALARTPSFKGKGEFCYLTKSPDQCP